MYTLAWYRNRGQRHTPVAGSGERAAGRRGTPQSLAVAVWVLLAVAGLGALSLYGFTGSLPARAALQWPSNGLLALDPARPTLFLFLHPRCPCSSASITELDRVLSQSSGDFRTYAILTVPPGVDEDWEAGRNLEAAKLLPETTVVFDRGGALARSFGARDSGTLLAFAPDGAHLFAGGLTVSRGHEGESLGSLALQDLAAGVTPRQVASPVFGCPLLGPDGATAGGGTP